MKNSYKQIKKYAAMLMLSIIGYTSVSAQYCTSGATKSGGEYISRVVVPGFSNESENSKYTDFTGLDAIVLHAQGTYNLSVYIHDYYKGNNVACWIDLNKDQVFDETGEVFFAKKIVVGDNVARADFAIEIPDAITEGESRMRITLSSETDVTPCMSYKYGETEDYKVDLKIPTEKPIADFKAGSTVIFVKSQTSFTNKTQGFAKTYEWTFTPSTVTFIDGTTANSKDPVVRFEEKGFYTVKLKATNQIGETEKVYDNYINVKNLEEPKSLTASSEGDQVTLKWSNPINEGWESYEDFTLSILPWTQLDFDNAYTAGFNGVTFPNQNYVGSAIVFNPKEAQPDVSSVINPHSGEKCLAIFRALQSTNDDWIISPQVHLGTEHQFSFWAKSMTDKYSLEKFNVGVSTKGNSDPKDFIIITPEPVEVSTKWTLYSYDLSAFAGKDAYVAVQCVTKNGFALLLDDFIISDYESAKRFNESFNEPQALMQGNLTMNTNVTNKQYTVNDKSVNSRYLIGTEVYRDNKLITTLTNSLLAEYTDKGVADGNHTYFIKSKYVSPEGISDKSNEVSILVDNKSAEVEVTSNDIVINTGDTYRVPGCTKVGEKSEIVIKITNKGTEEDLNLSGFAMSDSDSYKVTEQPATVVKPSESTTIKVEFSPSAKGYHTADISFNTNDDNEAAYNFTLKGTTGDEWTWTLYLYEDGTQLDGLKDFNEWEVLGSVEEKVNYIVLYDAYDDSKDGIYYVKKDAKGENRVLVSELISKHMGKDFDMNKSETLQEFILWTQSRFPANHYGITVWDHGSGIFRNNGDVMTKGCVGDMKLWELDDALDAFKKQAGQKVDIFGFDLCLLGQIETAYQLKDYADYVVFSEKTEPGDGWHYNTAFKMMNDNPQISPKEFAINLVDDYYEAFNSGVQQQGMEGTTQSAVSTDLLVSELVPALNNFSVKLAENFYDYSTDIRTAISSSWYSDDRKEHRDIGHFAKLINANAKFPVELKTAAGDFVTALEKAVINTRYTMPVNKNTTGMKAWMPSKITTSKNIDFYLNDEYLKFHETFWDEFLYVADNPIQKDKPRVKFNFSKATILTGESVMFENISVTIPFIQSYKWELPNDKCVFASGNETSRKMVVKFTQPGDYNIKLIVNNGVKDMECVQTIKVTDPIFMAPGNLSASVDKKNVSLKWFAPGEEMTLSEGFEGATFPPAGWETWVSKDMSGEGFEKPVDKNGRWFKVNLNSFGNTSHPEYIHNGDYSAGISFKAPDFNWLITPEVTISEGEDFYYWTWYKNGTSDTDGKEYFTKIHVLVFSEGKWNEELLWHDKAKSNFYDSEVKIELDKYEGKTIKIAFVYEYTDGFQMMIDDVTIRKADSRGYTLRGNGSSGELTGYKVFRDGTLLETVTGTSYVDENVDNGTYSYTVTATYQNPDGESEHSTAVEVILKDKDTGGPISVDSDDVVVIKIYPNPAKDNVSVVGVDNMTVSIYDVNGKLQFKQRATSDRLIIDLTGFDSGLYLVKINGENKVGTGKLIVE